MRIPFVDLHPRLQETEPEWKTGLTKLLERAQFILGEEVASFEAEFAGQMGARSAVAVANGTDAIALCLRAEAIGKGRNHVLTSPLTASFTGLAILSAECEPSFADVDPDTLLLDPVDAGNRLEKQTGAIVPVHLYGQCCELDRFAAVARTAGASLIQDACQAHGVRFGKTPLSGMSRYVAYSFYPTKNLGGLGDGGAVLTDNRAAAGRIRLLRDGGRRGGQVSYVRGVNSRLDEVQASYLRICLRRLAGWTAERGKLARIYQQALSGCPGIRVVNQRSESVYHLFVVRARYREHLRRYLAQHGIGTAVHYPVPLHLQPAFRGCGLKRGDLPHAEKACREILSLPLWIGMTETTVSEVADRIRSFYKKNV